MNDPLVRLALQADLLACAVCTALWLAVNATGPHCTWPLYMGLQLAACVAASVWVVARAATRDRQRT